MRLLMFYGLQMIPIGVTAHVTWPVRPGPRLAPTGRAWGFVVLYCGPGFFADPAWPVQTVSAHARLVVYVAKQFRRYLETERRIDPEKNNY